MATPPLTAAWQLGSWQIFPSLNRLQNAHDERTLEPRVMTALVVLLQADGAVVSDEQLLKGVWDEQIVSDASLYKVIAQLRKALGDNEKPYRFIERVSGKGYRLLMSASACASGELTATNAPTDANDSLTVTHDERHPLPATTRRTASKPMLLSIWLAGLLAIALTVWHVLTLSGPWPVKNQNVAIDKRDTVTQRAALLREQKPDSVTQQDWDNYLQAKWLAAQRKPDAIAQAITLFQSVLSHAPTFSAAEVELCNAYHFHHLYNDWPLSKVMALCEPLLRHALQTDASSAAALASFGLLKHTQGDVVAAATFLDKSLALAPDAPMVLMWRANVYRESGATADALSLHERAAALDPLSGIIKRHYAFSLIGIGRVGEARKVFQEALLLEPDYSNRAIDELDMLPLTVRRASDFLRWAQRFPDRINETNHPAPAINVALIYLSLGQLHDAEHALAIAEKKHPRHQFTLLARAMWHSANGDESAAQQALQQRAALQPTNPIYAVIALMHSASENPTSAKQKFLQWFPEMASMTPNTLNDLLESGRGQLVLYWLLTQTIAERQPYIDTINQWINHNPHDDNLCLNLHLVLGQTTQANQLAVQMLQNDWLPSPNDDFYIAEHNPLWKSLDKTFFEQLNASRQRVKAAAKAAATKE